MSCWAILSAGRLGRSSFDVYRTEKVDEDNFTAMNRFKSLSVTKPTLLPNLMEYNKEGVDHMFYPKAHTLIIPLFCIPIYHRAGNPMLCR